MDPVNSPFEVRQKDVVLTPALKKIVQTRSEELGRYSARIQRCIVRLEGPGGHHRQGAWSVRIDLVLPGTELVVHKHSDTNLESAITSAFRAMARRLSGWVRQATRLAPSRSAS
jgi:ribosome-associated translation inhibitor RaiA